MTRRKRVEAEIEDLILKGDAVWQSIAKRLQQIRDDKSWAIDNKSYRHYIQARWGKTEQWAYQLIRSRTAVNQIADKKPEAKQLFSSEGAARELAKVPEEKRAKVVEVVTTSGAPVTAKTIKAAAQSIKTKEPIKVLDQTGYPIPEDLLEIWDRSSEVQHILTSLSKLKGDLEQAQKSEDPLWIGIVFSAVLADLSKVWTGIAEAKPYCVCTQCQGRFPEKCVFCKGKGLISKFKFQTQTPEEMRELRTKSKK